MKMLKATWMSAWLQPNFVLIGTTNSVQPYCRLAIIAMQTTPMASCSQRVEFGVRAPENTSVILFLPTRAGAAWRDAPPTLTPSSGKLALAGRIELERRQGIDGTSWYVIYLTPERICQDRLLISWNQR